MAEEFQAAICGENRWNPPRTTFNRSSCSSVLTDLSPDSAFQTMFTSFSNSPANTTSDWNQNLLFRVQEGFHTFSTGSDDGSTTITAVENQGFSMDDQQDSSYGYSSSLLQSLFDCNSQQQQQQQQQPVYDFQSNSNDFDFISNLNLLRPKQQVLGNLQLSNNTCFLNASASPLDDNISGFFRSPVSQFPLSTYKQKESCPNVTMKPNHQEIMDPGSVVKKSSGESPFKRPRLETPSPLPTFKVRKEKLGDRITALQQLVSPFGKTDTASVLHEAIEYIKLLHDQVNILSTPYMKNGATMQPQQAHDKVKDASRAKQDLRSRGLCLVPVSSTFPVTTETTPGFWTPSYGGSFS